MNAAASSSYLVTALSQEKIAITLFDNREPLLIAGTVSNLAEPDRIGLIITLIEPKSSQEVLLGSTFADASSVQDFLPFKIASTAEIGRIRVFDRGLFTLKMSLPARLPSGLYRVNVYLFQGTQLLEEQEISLTVEMEGWSRLVAFWAYEVAFWYIGLAIGGALGIGWISYRWIDV